MNRRARYPADVLAVPAKKQPPRREVLLRLGIALTDRASGFGGTVVEVDGSVITLQAPDDGGRRAFPYEPDRFAQEGRLIRLHRKGVGIARPATLTSASGARVATTATPKVARASRMWVEGLHDAELLEKVWGDELRELAIVVEPMHGLEGPHRTGRGRGGSKGSDAPLGDAGADDLATAVRSFEPGPTRRLGVLLDHLVPGSKEQRIADTVDDPHVLVTGHPFVDVWAGVRPRVLGIDEWPTVPKGRPWKDGVAAALRVAEPREVWRRALAGVSSLADLETPLIGAVEQLLDFLTESTPDAN